MSNHYSKKVNISFLHYQIERKILKVLKQLINCKAAHSSIKIKRHKHLKIRYKIQLKYLPRLIKIKSIVLCIKEKIIIFNY